ncbi:MAG: hypothetical protein HGB34_01160 [Candidatus Moranbacteria bacterium]|nr:hypothetical protein [Candidatus Moranbacteria bacterium]
MKRVLVEKRLIRFFSSKGSLFGEAAMYEDADEYYAEMLKNPDNINIFLRDGDKRIGYLLAIPKHVAFDDEELRAADPSFRDNPEGGIYYVETAMLRPEYRKGIARC